MNHKQAYQKKKHEDNKIKPKAISYTSKKKKGKRDMLWEQQLEKSKRRKKRKKKKKSASKKKILKKSSTFLLGATDARSPSQHHLSDHPTQQQ